MEDFPLMHPGLGSAWGFPGWLVIRSIRQDTPHQQKGSDSSVWIQVRASLSELR